MNIAVQIASARDAAEFAALHGAATAPAWSGDEFTRLLLLPGAIGLIGSCAAAPAGLALAWAQGGEAEILSLAVLPAARRQGLGRALVEQVAARAQEMGALALFLEVSEANEAARRLYETAQFVEIGRRRAYYAGKTDALALRRHLGP